MSFFKKSNKSRYSENKEDIKATNIARFIGVQPEDMDAFLEKKEWVDELFELNNVRASTTIAAHENTNRKLLIKIRELHDKYQGTEKELSGQSLFYIVPYMKTVKDLEDLDYIDTHIYGAIHFKKSKSIPNGDEMFHISRKLYDIIMLKKHDSKNVTPENVIKAIELYNMLVKTDKEQANEYLYNYSESPDKYNPMLVKYGGKVRKMNKRKSIKRKSIKRKGMKNNRKTYKRK